MKWHKMAEGRPKKLESHVVMHDAVAERNQYYIGWVDDCGELWDEYGTTDFETEYDYWAYITPPGGAK